MIGVIFTFGTETVEVRINNNALSFRSSTYGDLWAPLDAIELNLGGVLRQFPDLKDDPDWKKKALERFKEKLLTMKDEDEQARYIIEDLTKYGYVARYMQKQGHRPVKV